MQMGHDLSATLTSKVPKLPPVEGLDPIANEPRPGDLSIWKRAVRSKMGVGTTRTIVAKSPRQLGQMPTLQPDQISMMMFVTTTWMAAIGAQTTTTQRSRGYSGSQRMIPVHSPASTSNVTCLSSRKLSSFQIRVQFVKPSPCHGHGIHIFTMLLIFHMCFEQTSKQPEPLSI